MRSILILPAMVLVIISGCVQPQTGPSNESGIEKVAAVTETWKPDGVVGTGEYARSIELSVGNISRNITLYWKNDADMLYMAMRGGTRGWVAVGFEPSEKMKDADMVMGFVNSSNVTVQDQYSTGTYGPHAVDTTLGGTNDILEYGGREDGNYTTIEFSRKMNTGDSYDKAFNSSQMVELIWSMASTDSIRLKHNLARGEGNISLE